MKIEPDSYCQSSNDASHAFDRTANTPTTWQRLGMAASAPSGVEDWQKASILTRATGFRDVVWVPRNLSADDYVTESFSGLSKTGVIEALPGILYLQSGTPRDYAVYGLADRHAGKLILPYESDQLAVKNFSRRWRKDTDRGRL